MIPLETPSCDTTLSQGDEHELTARIGTLGLYLAITWAMRPVSVCTMIRSIWLSST